METPLNNSNEQSSKPSSRGILDTVMSSQQTEALRSFNPQGEILKYLAELEPRESQILTSRYGLDNGEPKTLEEIGQQLKLTRERVRQVEKNALKKLRAKPMPEELEKSANLIYQIIEDRGNITRESQLHSLLSQGNAIVNNSINFILQVVPHFNLLRETPDFHQCWFLNGFDRDIFEKIISLSIKILDENKATLPPPEFWKKIRTSDGPELANLPDDALESMASASKAIAQNPFGEWGKANWSAIHPSDVGDKAYLVMEHHKKPEHYATITELINKQSFGGKQAHKETVHNELIKDERFVLVGRGIYALQKWGYKPGVVADIIEDVIKKAGAPLKKDEIVEAVLKQRLVKRNTIIVGLSNRKRFIKTSDNKYTLTNV